MQRPGETAIVLVKGSPSPLQSIPVWPQGATSRGLLRITYPSVPGKQLGAQESASSDPSGAFVDTVMA